MIGNTIEFRIYNWDGTKSTSKTYIGLVVDAFTKIEGGGASAFGFGDSKTTSKRVYKVEYYETWDKEKKFQKFIDIDADRVWRIISYAHQPQQETNEEKILPPQP